MASAEANGSCKVVHASAVAKSLLQEVREGLSNVDEKPLLVGFLANNDPAARMYADWTAKTCKENLREADREDIEDAILTANADPAVHGIIVYYPIFGNRQDQYLQQIVDMHKDVEGLSHRYIFNMYQNIRFLDDDDLATTPSNSAPLNNSSRSGEADNTTASNRQKSILPCTPLAIVKILEHLHIYNTILPYGNRLFGRTITIVNRSEVVGRPLAALLANDGACVYSVDADGVQQFTRGKGIRKRRHEVEDKDGWALKDALPLSDVVISGVPGDAFKVPVELVRDGAVCINFSSEKNFDAVSTKEKASIYVPAIGKVTIVILLRNLLRIMQNQRRQKQQDELNHHTGEA